MHIYRLEDRYGENTGREIFVGRTGIVVIDSLDHPRPVHHIHARNAGSGKKGIDGAVLLGTPGKREPMALPEVLNLGRSLRPGDTYKADAHGLKPVIGLLNHRQGCLTVHAGSMEKHYYSRPGGRIQGFKHTTVLQRHTERRHRIPHLHRIHPILIIHHMAPRKKHRHTAQYDSPK